MRTDVFVFVRACSDLSATCEFSSSKFQTLVATTSQNKGKVSCFVPETLLKEETVTFQPAATSNPPATRTYTGTRTLSSYTTRGWMEMECLQKKSEKCLSFPLQVFFHFKPFPSRVIYLTTFASFARTLGARAHKAKPGSCLVFFACDTQLPVVGDTTVLNKPKK